MKDVTNKSQEDKLVGNEERQIGAVGFSVYIDYIFLKNKQLIY